MKPSPEIILASRQSALDLRKQSLRLVPLAGKIPLVRNRPDLDLAEEEIVKWAEKGVNWGAINGDPLIVLDMDTEAEAWVSTAR